MLMIGDIFYIMLFVTTAGGVLTVLSLAASRTLRFMPPLWFSICRMAAYIIPLPAPGLYLISPEDHSWVHPVAVGDPLLYPLRCRKDAAGTQGHPELPRL